MEKNELLEEKEDILTEDFNTNLYHSNGIIQRQIEENLKHVKNKVTENEKRLLNQAITELEIKNAINDMVKEKCPGEDGLPKEFYHKFQDMLILELYNNIVLSGKRPISQKSAIIKRLCKKGDHRRIRNWRPVSLLNVDYKF